MEELSKVIELIDKHYKIRFVVEQVTFNGGEISYRLKRRKFFTFAWYKKSVDEYETNCIGTRMRFDSIFSITHYLKTQFAAPEGFVTEFMEMTSDSIVNETGVLSLIVDDGHQYEACVLCGDRTDVLKSTDINLRYGYFEGVGQLCKNCSLTEANA